MLNVIYMKSLLPAIPTVLIAGLLAIDFEGMLYRLYLLALIVVPGFSILALILYFACAIDSKNFRSNSATVFLILFLASLIFHLIHAPVHHLVQNHTSLNRVSVVITDTFKNNDQFEFAIVATGEGAKEDFAFHSGYTNVSINGNYNGGPGLDYIFNPAVLIECQGKYVPADEQNIIAVFTSQGMDDIALPEYASKFRTHLNDLASPNHLLDSGKSHVEIGFQPDGNTVYRIMFACTSVFALVFSTIITARRGSK